MLGMFWRVLCLRQNVYVLVSFGYVLACVLSALVCVGMFSICLGYVLACAISAPLCFGMFLICV